MKTFNNKQRRKLLKVTAAVCISPSMLFSHHAHAGWPWLLRFLGVGTARKTAAKNAARRAKREFNYRSAMSTAYEGTEVVSALSAGGLLFGTTRTNIAAKTGLHKLIYKGGNINVPEARISHSELGAAQLPLLYSDKARAVYLDVPPLAKGIHDNVAWGVVDVLHGEISMIGKCPVTVNASAASDTMELPLRNLSVTGPHQFIAVLEKHADSVPIFSTSVMEVR